MLDHNPSAPTGGQARAGAGSDPGCRQVLQVSLSTLGYRLRSWACREPLECRPQDMVAATFGVDEGYLPSAEEGFGRFVFRSGSGVIRGACGRNTGVNG